MTPDMFLTIALTATSLTLLWALMRANALYDMVTHLQECLAAIADGKANVQRYGNKIVVIEMED